MHPISNQRLSPASYNQFNTGFSGISNNLSQSPQATNFSFPQQGQGGQMSGLGGLITMLGRMVQKLTSVIGGMMSGGANPTPDTSLNGLGTVGTAPLGSDPSKETSTADPLGGLGNIFSSITNKLPDMISGISSIFTGGLGSLFGGGGGGSLLSGITGLFK